MTKNASKQFIWNALGSLSTALLSIILLTIVSRLSSSYDADVFAFAYSLSHLFIVIGLFQVRNFQSTDILQKYTFKDYAILRLISVVLMMLSLLFYIIWNNFSFDKNSLIVVIVLYRVTDAISDLFQGFFQQHASLDIAGKSLFFRNLSTVSIFFIALLLTKNLLGSLVLMLIASAIFVILWDFLNYKSFEYIEFNKGAITNIVTIFRETLPLFINGILIIAVFNQPKYVIDDLFEIGVVENGIQLTFNVLFTPVFVINLMLLFLRPLITEMAIFLSKNDYQGFYKLKNRLLYAMTIISVMVLVVSYFLGIPVLEIVFGLPLKEYKLSFLVLMLGGVVISFATIFDNILTTMRKQKFLVIPYFLSFVTSLLITKVLIVRKEIEGAALSFLIAVTVWLVISIVVYSYFIKKLRRS